jgi:tryptophan-rich sensory protein
MRARAVRIRSLAANLAVFVGAVLVVNAIVFGLRFPGAAGDPSGPPGWVVGLVWTALFTLFGTAHWMLQAPANGAGARFWLAAFAILCLSYPFYTLGLGNRSIGLAGNVVTGFAAILLVRRLRAASETAALLVAPVLPWLVFASWSILPAVRE